MRSQAVLHLLDEHFHSTPFVFPDLAASVELTAEAPAWDNTAALVELIAAGAITSSYDIHWADIVLNNDGEYQLGLYAGGAGSEVLVCPVTITRVTNQVRSVALPIMMPKQPANTRLSARIASGQVNADTINIKISGHRY